MVARVVTLTEAKAKLSEILDAVERGEEFVIVRHGERIARLRSYRVTEQEDGARAPTLAARLRRLRDASAADRAVVKEIFRREGRRDGPRDGHRDGHREGGGLGAAELKKLAREGLE